MANLEHLALLREGKEPWSRWRAQHPDQAPDLVAADLNDAGLRGRDLRGARLNGATLERADLHEADLSGADLRGASLAGARGSYANLSGADLAGADLRGVFLAKANLAGARLNGATLAEARCSRVALARADLRGADLTDARLGHVDLTDADLRGALLDASLYATYLPDTSAASDRHARHHQIIASLQPEPPEEESMISRRFAVGAAPLLRLIDIGGPVTICPWPEPAMRVLAAADGPAAEQTGDTVTLRGGGLGPVTVWVPRIARGIMRLMRHGSASILTTIAGERIAGNVLIEDAGHVDLHDVTGQVAILAAESVALRGLARGAVITRAFGTVTLADIAFAVLERVEGSVFGERVARLLIVETIGGNCVVRDSASAEIALGHIGGNAQLEGVASVLECAIGGNAELALTFPAGASAIIRTGGTARLRLPFGTDLALEVTAGGAIRGAALREPKVGPFAHLRLGRGQAQAEINAGADVWLDEAGAPTEE